MRHVFLGSRSFNLLVSCGRDYTHRYSHWSRQIYLVRLYYRCLLITSPLKYEAHMKKHLVVVAGNIGVVKTSLTERIGARLGWWTGYESVADNPYLADFYSDMHAWAFHLQIFFLGHRADQYMVA